MNGHTHSDPFLSPWQTNPTAGTPEDAAAQPDMARDLDRELKARDEDDSGNRHTLDEVVEDLGIDESDDEGEAVGTGAVFEGCPDCERDTVVTEPGGGTYCENCGWRP